MSTPAPLAATLVIPNKINEVFKSYVDAKGKFAQAVTLSMLGATAGFCHQLVTSGDPAMFTDHNLLEPVFIVRQEYNTLNDLNKAVTNPVGFNIVRDFCKKVQLICDATNAQKHGAADVAAVLLDVKPKPRPCKAVKSKATVDDKDDDDDIEIVGNVDVTMGVSDGPITAASGSDAMTIDNLFNGDVEAKVSTKDKGKKRATPKAAFKRAEMVCIPYAAVPGMDTENRIYSKAVAIESGQVASSSNKHARTELPHTNGLVDLQHRRGHSLSLDSSIKDFIIACTKAILDSPMPGKPTLEYYHSAEMDLRNHVITSIQRLDLELKLYEVLHAEYETIADLLKDYEEIEVFLA
ncbi:uncharacterized protein LACBIDRAFT_318469 [Laccaria bicolor S238N-H82]|uniref:Predicted protein n=1 Tax=Laccaria bicolor (strain S238N-H82 / ATCC MYA-4686) TaxID=486041 RepID=B0E2I4_LACBS|nr:uncharacterized protein LACBIDRAFT_318469 [Laccaria bicolor S238N-H82]EDQ98944.1 predicted protein [Laccaria bicolor S238N-H82]|eukprot:XP_001890395.1 predicted protein [Laccaria bicolor S238N-H82]